MIKWSFHQGDKIIINVYASNINFLRHLKQELIKLKVEDNSIITVDF